MKPKDNKPGTRPADIKRYLAPLLKERSDLVSMGGLLVIRPVRHLLRGARFVRNTDKYSFQLWWYVQPLYEPYSNRGYGDYAPGKACAVWQPHFQPLLMDTLAHVFSQVGPITTLGEFADALAVSKPGILVESARLHALLLGGEREAAESYMRELERRGVTHYEGWTHEERAFLARDIDELCTELHANEAELVKEMQLEEIWEPSPFPVELPASERARSAEPQFPTTPWISRPSWLLQDAPERPGDVRFAKSMLLRDQRSLMLVPLSRDEAETRHRNEEPYVLAARSEDGVLFAIYYGGFDRHAPDRRSGQSGVFPVIYGTDCEVNVWARSSEEREGFFDLTPFSVRDRRSNDELWYCFASVERGKTEIQDRRAGERRSERALTDFDINLLTFAKPPFGEFEDLAMRIRTWLRRAGFGEIR